MVFIISNQSDGAVYETSLFNVAGKSAANLKEGGQNVLRKHFGEQGFPFLSSKESGVMSVHSMAMIPLIMKESYQMLPESFRVEKRKFASLFLVKKEGEDVIGHLFDSEKPSAKKYLDKLEEKYFGPEGSFEEAKFFILLAARTEIGLMLQPQQMEMNTRKIQEDIFAKNKFKLREIHIPKLKNINSTEVQGLNRVFAAAEYFKFDLFTRLANAYGVSREIIILDKSKRELFIGEKGFEVMERGEMPERYRGAQRL